MPQLPKAKLDKRKTIRLSEYELNYLEYISRLEHVTANSLIRRLIREHGETLGISFYHLNHMGVAAYDSQRQELLIAQGQRREMAQQLNRLQEELKLYAK